MTAIMQRLLCLPVCLFCDSKESYLYCTRYKEEKKRAPREMQLDTGEGGEEII